MNEKINGIRKLLEDNDMDKEVRCYLESQLESLERDIKIYTTYDEVIEEVYVIIKKLNLDNEVGFSNVLINFIPHLQKMDNSTGLNFFLDLQNVFKGINFEDSKEIMSHVYTRFFTDHIKKISNDL